MLGGPLPLPPLVRGGHVDGVHDPVVRASTPARAGRTGPRAGPGRGRGLYPRSCGEDRPTGRSRSWARPLPPLVRGGPQRRYTRRRLDTSTPARAGRTWRRPVGKRASGLYPRSCGEDTAATSPPTKAQPLPPLVRGGLTSPVPGPPRPTSTPARAGRTCPGSPAPRRTHLYPRSCGEDPWRTGWPRACQPLPPLVRGGHVREGSVGGGLREGSVGGGLPSTPARAGRTCRWRARSRGGGLYPRSCGEDLADALGMPPAAPLPPLVRGGLLLGPTQRCENTSTPARAGRTLRPGWRCPTGGLYPRSCGEDSCC